MIKVILNGREKEFENNMSVFDAVKSLGGGMYKDVFAAKINGENKDIRTVLNDGDTVDTLNFDDDYGKWTFRHTASHILAQAVKRVYPNALLAIGPAIDDGFYYDIDTEEKITPESLEKIEAEMKKIVKEDIRLERSTMARQDA
ncbi:MAG: TGS domain-containing protein, partial [Clostridia bacterium]|nr:TGS domain-containing protein [Clostridia bacterium]